MFDERRSPFDCDIDNRGRSGTAKIMTLEYLTIKRCCSSLGIPDVRGEVGHAFRFYHLIFLFSFVTFFSQRSLPIISHSHFKFLLYFAVVLYSSPSL